MGDSALRLSNPCCRVFFSFRVRRASDLQAGRCRPSWSSTCGSASTSRGKTSSAAFPTALRRSQRLRWAPVCIQRRLSAWSTTVGLLRASGIVCFYRFPAGTAWTILLFPSTFALSAASSSLSLSLLLTSCAFSLHL